MKVLLINNCHWRRGGSEAVYFGIAELLVSKGHEIVFLSLDDEKNIKTDQKEYFVKRGNPFYGIISYFSNGDASSAIDEVLTKEKPDIAHAHLMWGGMTASIISVLHKHGVPLVHTSHDFRMVCPAYTFRNGKGGVCEECKGGNFIHCVKNRCGKGSLIRSVLMTAEMYYRNRKWHPAKELDGIIFVSKFSKQKHEESDPLFKETNNIVLYNFTTIGNDYPPVEQDGGYYLYYGRLSEEKGIDTLLRVFSKHPELTLKVVGTGPLEESLKKKYNSTFININEINNSNLNRSIAEGEKCHQNIQFLGYHSGSELAQLVRNARFVCVPSECYENNPMTIVEAYSMGVPVIGAQIGGIPEIVEEGQTGFLFESGNVESLENAVLTSTKVNDEGYAELKRNTIDFAYEHFNSDIYLQQLISFYNKVLNSFHYNK